VPPVVFGPAARAELIEARDWYGARDVELAARFTAEVEMVVDRIAATPEQFPVVYRDVRRARYRRFPYALFFRIMAGKAHVVACFHSSRDPHQWQGRS
jgi:toxin ParE1/3/4